MYIADCNNHRIMRYLTNSTTGVNGTMVAGGNGAGTATNQLYYPWGITYRPSISSDLYISNFDGHSVVRWTPGASSGILVAGVAGVAGSNATSLSSPMGVRLDMYLNMFVADSQNHRIQMFCYNNQTGITLAGTGVAGSTATQLNDARSLAFDSSMNLYVTDYANSRVQKFLKL